MRFVFAVILFLHGLISLMGFLKAFNILKLEQFEADITKGAGSLWFLSSILLFVIAVQAISKSDLFWILGSIALVLSQIIIIWFWKDAKYGTIINIILLILVVINFSMWNHNRNAKKKGVLLLENCKPLPIKENSHLPDLIVKWLDKSGCNNTAPPSAVHFTQEGKLRLAPEKPWMSFNANQYVRLNTPSFIWAAKVGQGEMMQFSGVDQFKNGKGKMNIALYGMIDVVDASGEKMNEGTAVRYLAEIVWYPWMARSKHIQWKSIDDQTVKALFSYEDVQIEGLFSFSSDGFPIQFEAQRYNEEKKKEIAWRVDIDRDSYVRKGNVLIPIRASVIWEYESGDFHWLDIEIKKHFS